MLAAICLFSWPDGRTKPYMLHRRYIIAKPLRFLAVAIAFAGAAPHHCLSSMSKPSGSLISARLPLPMAMGPQVGFTPLPAR